MLAYLVKTATGYTVKFEGAVPFIPTHVAIPLPFNRTASWILVVDYIAKRFPTARIYYNGSQV